MNFREELNIHHIGYAVKNIDKSVELFRHMGYAIHEKTIDTNRRVTIVFAELSNYRVELIAPLSYGSPVDNILKKSGPTPYHICYEIDDISKACKLFGDEKFRMITEIQPAPAINNSNVVFLYNPIMGLIELVEI